jgi:hypothetical protein
MQQKLFLTARWVHLLCFRGACVRTVIIIRYLVLNLFDLLQRRVMFLPQKWRVDDILYTVKEIFKGKKMLTTFYCRLIWLLLTLSRLYPTIQRGERVREREKVASNTARNSRGWRGVGAE